MTLVFKERIVKCVFMEGRVLSRNDDEQKVEMKCESVSILIDFFSWRSHRQKLLHAIHQNRIYIVREEAE